MKYKFYSAASQTFDLLQFPKLLFYNQHNKQFEKEEESIQKIVKEEYKVFLNKVEKILTPFKKEIEMFYVKEMFSDIDFYEMFTKFFSVIKYKDPLDYLNQLQTLNEQEIKECMIQSLLINQNEEKDGVSELSKKICQDSSETIFFIKSLDLEASFKWNLFLIVEEPKKYMEIYVDLMKKIYPIFLEIYNPYVDKVNAYGNKLVKYLNENGVNALSKISYSTIDDKILNGEKHHILISCIFPYKISIQQDDESYLIWGLYIEEALKQLNEIDQDKMNSRIKIFKMLGDKTRYEVLKLIAQGITSTKDIASRLGVSSATISYHINAYLTSKLIKMDNSSKKMKFVVDYELLQETWNEFMEDLKQNT